MLMYECVRIDLQALTTTKSIELIQRVQYYTFVDFPMRRKQI